jgi:hypothetical protein
MVSQALSWWALYRHADSAAELLARAEDFPTTMPSPAIVTRRQVE